MGKNEKTSEEMASLASRAMRKPESLSLEEIKSLGATGLTQAADKKKLPAKAKAAPKPAPRAAPKPAAKPPSKSKR